MGAIAAMALGFGLMLDLVIFGFSRRLFSLRRRVFVAFPAAVLQPSRGYK
jgi:hypothetical protein